MHLQQMQQMQQMQQPQQPQQNDGVMLNAWMIDRDGDGDDDRFEDTDGWKRRGGGGGCGMHHGGGGMYHGGGRCRCRRCWRKQRALKWTIALLLLVIAGLLMKQARML